jgi:hypothetical protein
MVQNHSWNHSNREVNLTELRSKVVGRRGERNWKWIASPSALKTALAEKFKERETEVHKLY